MKDELIKFIMEYANKEYYDDFPIENIPEWIEKFFKQHQPERSEREDPTIKGYFPPPWNITDFPEKTKGWLAFQDELEKYPDYYGMRCSEHDGNIVREVQ